jgi:hypothetical protein
VQPDKQNKKKQSNEVEGKFSHPFDRKQKACALSLPAFSAFFQFSRRVGFAHHFITINQTER